MLGTKGCRRQKAVTKWELDLKLSESVIPIFQVAARVLETVTIAVRFRNFSI